MRRNIIALILAVLLVAPAVASEEEFLNFKEVKVVSYPVAELGVVIVETKVNEIDNTFEKFSVYVFGQQYDLEPGDLKKIAGFPLSSLQVTHEAGYEVTGGYTLHLRLTRRIYENGRQFQSRALISISKNKGLNVRDVDKYPI